METDPAANAQWLLGLMGWVMWTFVGVAALFYFVTSYLFEVLAQKQDEPRWMAWVPIANGLLMLRLVGWGRFFWVFVGGYALVLLTLLLPGPLTIIGMVVSIPLALGGLALGLAYFPVLATKRGLGIGVGLLVVVPQFLPGFFELSVPGTGAYASAIASLVALGAFLKIVFHDGRPAHGPHPVGYALTLVGTVGVGLALQALPGWLAQQEGFEEAMAELGTELASTPFAGFAPDPSASPDSVAETAAPEDARLDAPDPVEVADTCPAGTRERRGPDRGGRAWWCELETGSGWVRHGPERTWHDNGYLRSEGRYDHGQRTGTWTRFWRTGGREVQAEFENGVQHGWMHRFDALGELETAVLYVDGEVSAL